MDHNWIKNEFMSSSDALMIFRYWIGIAGWLCPNGKHIAKMGMNAPSCDYTSFRILNSYTSHSTVNLNNEWQWCGCGGSADNWEEDIYDAVNSLLWFDLFPCV